MDTGLHALQVPAAQRLATFGIGLCKHQVPDRTECIYFDFVIVKAISVRIEKNFEIIVIEYYFIFLADVRPDMRFLKFGSDVDILFIPEQFHPGLKGRF